jgi:predicted ATP-dependent endonuclease of OLD family
MKITVRNLGVIEEAAVDLKPLTVFVGPNNQGKTWLAYLYASIFGSPGFFAYLSAYKDGMFSDAFTPLGNIMKQAIEDGSATINLIDFADSYIEKYFNNIASVIKQWMPDIMSTCEVSFDGLDINLELGKIKEKILNRVLKSQLKIEIPIQTPLITIRKKNGEKKLYVYTTKYESSEDTTEQNENIFDTLPIDDIRDLLIQNTLDIVHRSLFNQVRVLPTERTTFINLPFSSSKRGTLSKISIQTMTEQSIEPSETYTARKRLIGPVGTFISMMEECFELSTLHINRRKTSAKNNPQIRAYVQIADLLEKLILGGRIEISQQENLMEEDHIKELLFQPTEHNKLEIAIASSMVKELSPLVLYLRYLAKPNELLIIDEPEMNLHPEAQVKMIELLAMLSNAGLNILITTHSPYVVDHLTNLIKAYEAENQESICNQFYLKHTDAFISKDNVSVYLIDKGHAERAIDDEGLIQLETFGEVSDHISDIYFQL